jgi:hypoxanthine-DNA glycosylase
VSDAVKTAFSASVDEKVKLLILGTLPSETSLAARQYYANPTNQFWRLIGGVIGETLHTLDYEDRLARLSAAGVGLWDVIASARRTGSLDSSIRDHRANDLGALMVRLPSLRALGFNGGKAARIGRKQIASAASVALVDLPSSSAAYCSISFEAKQAQWLPLRHYIRNA